MADRAFGKNRAGDEKWSITQPTLRHYILYEFHLSRSEMGIARKYWNSSTTLDKMFLIKHSDIKLIESNGIKVFGVRNAIVSILLYFGRA